MSIPLGLITCITGVSGSGKSSLINDTLYPSAANLLNRASLYTPGAAKEILGLNLCDKVIDIDQSPIGRTPRSNPATYTGIFTHIRELFAATLSLVPVATSQGVLVLMYAVAAVRHVREMDLLKLKCTFFLIFMFPVMYAKASVIIEKHWTFNIREKYS